MGETESNTPRPDIEPEPVPEGSWTLASAVPASFSAPEPPADEPPPVVGAPVSDPWSRPTAKPYAPPEPAPAITPVTPQGWQWSRDGTAAMPVLDLDVTDTGSVATLDPPPAVVEATTGPKTALGRLGLDLLALFMALIGGLLALIGAFFQELQSGLGIVLVVVGAPIIEEALKPAGIFLLLVKWPQALRGPLHTALLCAISGAVFGIVESLIYVELYYPDGNDNFVLFRFTVTPVMHAVASFIVGFGLSRGLLDWANGRSPLPKLTRNCFIAGMGLHAAYNTSMVILGLFGVMDFLET